MALDRMPWCWLLSRDQSPSNAGDNRILFQSRPDCTACDTHSSTTIQLVIPSQTRTAPPISSLYQGNLCIGVATSMTATTPKASLPRPRPSRGSNLSTGARVHTKAIDSKPGNSKPKTLLLSIMRRPIETLLLSIIRRPVADPLLLARLLLGQCPSRKGIVAN